MTRGFDIVVAGGGHVGASMALALRPLGLAVAVVEARPRPQSATPHYDDRSTALAVGSRRVLEAIGVWRFLGADVEPIRRVHVSEQGRPGVVVLDAREAAQEALGWVAENPPLARAFDRALDDAGIERLQPATIVAVDQDDPDAVELEVDAGGVMQRLRARLVIAADGADSAMRAAAGIGHSELRYEQTALVANVTAELAHGGTAWERFTRRGPVALLPLPGRRCASIWTVASGEAARVMALDDDAFAAEVDALFGSRLGGIERVGRRQAWPLARILAREQWRGRIALVGNAAHSMHPIAGQGFNLSLRDCAALAEAVDAGVRRTGDPADPSALARWADERRADQQRVLTFTDGLNALFALDLPGLGALRGAGLALFGLAGPARRLLARYGTGIGAPLPKLARGVPLR